MTSWKYLPILKWKQGERIALRNLTVDQWEEVVPLFELLPIGAAPNFHALQEQLPGYLAKVATELKTALPEGQICAVDTRYVSRDYPKKVQLLHAVCQQLSRLTERKILPVITSDLVQSESGQLGRLVDHFDECIVRINSPSVIATQVQPILDLVHVVFKKQKIHAVIDQFSMVGADFRAAAMAIKPYLDAAVASKSASVTIAGGSFPENLIGFKQGTFDIERVEWRVWEQIHKDGAYPDLRYSDYSVTHPALGKEMDPSQVNPSVAIRYAADGFWRLFKAGGFKGGKPNQYMALCQLLLLDSVYTGPTYSFGDKCYDDAANSRRGNGNPSSWRRDATSHHLVLTRQSL